ncbi:hypothetical protein H2204_000413 [Knufia peltigerae]|uniref:FAD/NAD(P)-binding domain-containing protein n=1 Tax=Knufia peltigerae TaxID=1002370 RepID=A0AA38YEM7_9EURO|nr:hypothetical protein H2204_000413 [Knufia peltigerae]
MGSIGPQNGIEGENLDVLIIGAGFTGCYLLPKLRNLGFKTKIVESGSYFGGVWYWSRYPGARVDSPYPYYSLSLPEVYKDWEYKELFPPWHELQRYFAHVDKTLGLSKDAIFNSRVTSATFNEDENTWTVECHNGKLFKTRFLVAGIGFAAKEYVPQWKGMDKCKARIVHSSHWPADLDIKGKKLAVIGNGATGVQLIQECADQASELTAFIRTPNICLPMQQKPLISSEQKAQKQSFPELYQRRLTTVGGLEFTAQTRAHADFTPEEREELLERLWKKGGFAPFAASFNDTLTSPTANDTVYQFWLKKTRARVPDKAKAAIVAPSVAPHPFGAKRPSLEQDYYEKISRPNVSVVSVKETPITEFSQDGIVTADGKVHKFDIIALATGYDAITGSYKNIDIRGLGRRELNSKWKSGTRTYLGMATQGFPNLFFTYGPQSPGPYVNGPSCTEPQCDWIADVLSKLRDQCLSRIDPDENAERQWSETVNAISKATLIHEVKSWWTGANIPGKPMEALGYLGGLPNYLKALKDSLENDLQGFKVS